MSWHLYVAGCEGTYHLWAIQERWDFWWRAGRWHGPPGGHLDVCGDVLSIFNVPHNERHDDALYCFEVGADPIRQPDACEGAKAWTYVVLREIRRPPKEKKSWLEHRLAAIKNEPLAETWEAAVQDVYLTLGGLLRREIEREKKE